MAADAASYAPPDFKRQLVKHRDRLMAGVKAAAEADPGTREPGARREAAARGARVIARQIREHGSFAEVAYQVGGLLHELAAADPPRSSPAEVQKISKAASFLGYASDPFAETEKVVVAPLPAGSPRDAYDATVTRTTRLLAWIWKTAGGDASIVKKFPETKRGYAIRE